MPRTRSIPLERAITHLRTVLDTNTGNAAHRLPGIARLAQDAGVAYVTMWKAVKHLKKDGVITARPNRGIIAGPRLPDDLPAHGNGANSGNAGHRVKWQRLTQRIEADILKGVLPPGSCIPRSKELLDRYGVCRQTLDKALASLVEQGRLQPQRTRLIVPSAAGPRHRSTIALVAAGNRTGNLRMVTPRTHENVRNLEQECSRAGVHLVTCIYDDESGHLTMPENSGDLFDMPQGRGSLLGIIIWQAGIDLHNWTDLVIRFAQMKLPMALLDENGESIIPGPLRRSALVRLFALGYSAEAGLHMGRHLIGLGHRRVAYISPVHGSLWSKNRLAGIRQAFETAGMPRAVVTTTDDAFVTQEAIRRSVRPIRESIAGVLDKTLRNNPHPDITTERTIRALIDQIDPVLQHEAYAGRVIALLEPLIDNTEITAWVAADDDTALPCLEFLRSRGRRIPQEISLAGFDDGLDASVHKLTSFNYNGPAVMHAMLAHIVDPVRGVARPQEDAAMEIPGMLVVRATTGRAPVSRLPG